MFSKIYYGLGIAIMLLYLVASIAPKFKTKPAPQPYAFGTYKIERGKYIPPSSSSSNSTYYGTGSGSRKSSYSSGGGYSGGK